MAETHRDIPLSLIEKLVDWKVRKYCGVKAFNSFIKVTIVLVTVVS